MTERAEDVGDVATFWVVRLSSDQRTRADEAAFRAWLEADPAHARAYADCVALWDSTAELAKSEEAYEVLRPLRATVRDRRRFNRRIAVFGGFGAIAAAAAAAIIGPVLAGGEQTLQTAPGEQKRVRLADGTDLLLNTDSRLRVRFVARERRLFLDRGQAFFQVAKDKTRPFRVFAGRDEVRALGTAFDVRLLGDRVQVTLEEGGVAIYQTGDALPRIMGSRSGIEGISASAVSSGPSDPVAILSRGEQATLVPARPIAVREVDLRQAQAWRYGRMILDDAPLSETVADLNRYGGVQIVLADPKLADIRVSGVFHTGRPDDFVESVTAAFPVEIARRDEHTIVLKAR